MEHEGIDVRTKSYMDVVSRGALICVDLHATALPRSFLPFPSLPGEFVEFAESRGDGHEDRNTEFAECQHEDNGGKEHTRMMASACTRPRGSKERSVQSHQSRAPSFQKLVPLSIQCQSCAWGSIQFQVQWCTAWTPIPTGVGVRRWERNMTQHHHDSLEHTTLHAIVR
jgi:hypothetical protein